jgi:hypothetical protein
VTANGKRDRKVDPKETDLFLVRWISKTERGKPVSKLQVGKKREYTKGGKGCILIKN